MTCKDCIHYCRCKDTVADENWRWEDFDNDQKEYIKSLFTPDNCEDFKHKDKFVELPLYIGQDIWQVYQRWNNKIFVAKGKVSMLQQKADKSWKFRMSVDGSVIDFTVDAIGDYIFLTEEDANTKADELTNIASTRDWF